MDMTRRYQRSGCGLRAVYKLRARDRPIMHEPALGTRILSEVGENSARLEHRLCRLRAGRARGFLFVSWARKRKPLELAEPILHGSMRCETIPHTTYAFVLLPFLQTGQVEKAMEYHHKGYRLISGNRHFLAQIGDHLTFLALTDNLSQAIKLFEETSALDC